MLQKEEAMDQRVQPQEDHDLLISLWTFMVGTNGDGLLGQFQAFKKETNDSFQEMQKQLAACWTIEDHKEAEKGYEKKSVEKEETRDRRKISAREWILGIALVVTTVATVVMPHIWK
jgi:hypothetical protein